MALLSLRLSLIIVEKSDPAAHLSFNLTLTEEQREAKEKLLLPYLKAQGGFSCLCLPLWFNRNSIDNVAVGGGAGGGPTSIYYTPDSDDDFDEEDPDDDLDI